MGTLSRFCRDRRGGAFVDHAAALALFALLPRIGAAVGPALAAALAPLLPG